MALVEQIFWVYPWDISDASVEDRLGAIRNLGATAISIPFAYHSVRALAPHREGRKVISAAAALGFRPRPGEFSTTGIRPPSMDWAADEGPVPGLMSHAEKNGLRIKAWTVVFHSSPLASANADAAIRNCFEDTFSHALCPSAPKAREYAVRLVRAISARPVHAIELEAVGFYGYEHLSLHDKCGVAFDLFHQFLFSCCFCPHCTELFKSAGLNPGFLATTFRQRLLSFFEGRVPPVKDVTLAHAELSSLLGEKSAIALLNARSRCVLTLLQEIRETVPRSIELTVSSGLSPFECGALFGANPQDTLTTAKQLLLVVFEPDETAFRSRFEAALDCVGDRSRWIAGIRIFPPDVASESAIDSRLAFLHKKGFGAVQLYHYGLAPTYLLNAAAKTLQKLKGAHCDREQ
jgi:hypothetical protein